MYPTFGNDFYVGKLFGIATLGIYQMAYNFSNLATTEITHVISRVTFPAYAKLQNDIPRLREAFLRILKVFLLDPKECVLHEFIFNPFFSKAFFVFVISFFWEKEGP